MPAENLLQRKGARRPADVPPEVLDLLQQGELETVNLSEWLAMDQRILIEHTFPEMGLDRLVPELTRKITTLKKPTTMRVITLVGGELYTHAQAHDQRGMLFKSLSTHRSDCVRCYAPYLFGLDESMLIHEQLQAILISASDAHFGVREIAWMALRPAIAADLSLAIPALESWVRSPDENVRRFATEATRPRGVWCKHIAELKDHPELAASLLDPLLSDPSRYVQNSVGNWLNDAAKTRPDFVRELTDRWLATSDSKETAYIVKRALRSL